MRPSFVLSLLAVVAPALGAPTLIPIIKRAGPFKQDSYIITFKDGASKSAAVEALKQKFAEPNSQSELTHNYDVFPGLAVHLAKPEDLPWVQMLAGVAFIEQDQIMSINYEQGIDGLSDGLPEVATASPLVGRTGGGGKGEGVTVYGIDTGIYTAHNCFGGRATWGATFGATQQQEGDVDLNGHGTHTAGTAVGKGYGVADGAHIVAVKVLGGDGSGAMSDVVKGVDWSSADSKTRGGKAIATMSLGGPALLSNAVKIAVDNAIDRGLHFTVAAGNDNLPAETATPANVKAANTIGAVDSSNKKASFSNFGGLIDVWAPGVDITSAWIDSPDAKNTISGTSMATPYVAGILAVALGKYGSMSPQALSEQLKGNAKPVVKGVLPGTTNKLATEW